MSRRSHFTSRNCSDIVWFIHKTNRETNKQFSDAKIHLEIHSPAYNDYLTAVPRENQFERLKKAPLKQ